MQKFPLTVKGAEKLREEVAELKSVARPRVIAAIAEAVDEDTQEKMPSWSNYGDAVKYAAPGVSIFSLWKDGGTKTISGTSMAAPHACAVLMLTGAGSDNTEAEKYYDEDTGTYPIIHTDY